MKRIIVSLAACALLLTAACSSEADGQAEPTGSAPTPPASSKAESSPSASSDLPHSGAPAVENPLPEAVLEEHPCDAALTPQQLDDALGKEGVQQETKDTGAGPGCDWSNPERFSGLQVGYNTATREGLSAFYQNTKPKSAVFQEADPVAGFPAVEFQPSVGSDFCTTAVGLADEYSVSVTVTVGDEGADPCQGAARVAADVVGNLKAKA
ncbi:Protein of unknown function (DUF3558) [Prauserella aidingensis]|uniref:DUF3558 domain-containing protein n=1 Tax=Prauserella aidingensis TaxID=387890 RepID=UPI0020A41B96|nr:DUF3558 domain-containing protein [Prauserella aidingensis]MCP2255643.1 Protein of unknown function (DUF3558) [Prauserella aidingensis]